jgi:hypothetical protein
MVAFYTMKTYGGSRSNDPLIHNLGATRTSVVIFTPVPLYLLEKNPFSVGHTIFNINLLVISILQNVCKCV